MNTTLDDLKEHIDSKIPLENNRCFANCITALEHGYIDIDEWFYTEGVLESPYSWMYHGWLTNRAGEIWDLTLNTDNIYHPRFHFNSYDVYELMERYDEVPLTRHIYLNNLNKDDIVVYDGYEFNSFDYSKYPEDYQGPLTFLLRSE